ncbi:hypothetical protein SAMN05421747_11446 [Parapedobacter composti]|uniref:Uncharacterized protein n=1 Tax=Parapedobacter composti TaxID=623281 RepID=A0A1I1K9P1_9SPHI|nr:hypothetical protein SAMN05421747_11446 [Parapedobacter composti]
MGLPTVPLQLIKIMVDNEFNRLIYLLNMLSGQRCQLCPTFNIECERSFLKKRYERNTETNRL